MTTLKVGKDKKHNRSSFSEVFHSIFVEPKPTFRPFLFLAQLWKFSSVITLEERGANKTRLQQNRCNLGRMAFITNVLHSEERIAKVNYITTRGK